MKHWALYIDETIGLASSKDFDPFCALYNVSTTRNFQSDIETNEWSH